MTNLLGNRAARIAAQTAFACAFFACLACWMPVHAQTNVIIRGIPLQGSGQGALVPWDAATYTPPGPSSRVQCLYLQEEVGPAGTISALAWYPNGSDDDVLETFLTVASTYGNVVVRFGHRQNKADASGDVLTTTFANNCDVGSLVTVYSGPYSVLPNITQNTAIDIPLDTTFYYNGVDNLIIDIQADSDPAAVRNNLWEISNQGNRFLADAFNRDAVVGTLGGVIISIRLTKGGMADGGGGGGGGGGAGCFFEHLPADKPLETGASCALCVIVLAALSFLWIGSRR